MSRKKNNELLDLVNKANGIETEEDQQEEVVEFEYDLETFIPKKNKTTGYYDIFHVFINSSNVVAHLEVEETKVKSKATIINVINDRTRKLYLRGQFD